MKKIFSMACIFSLFFALTACGSQSNNTDDADSTAEPSVSQADRAQDEELADSSVPSSEEQEDEQADAEPESDTKILVAYFSATGTTKVLAEYAADAMEADLYEIMPEEPYTDEDLDYSSDRSRSSLEMNDPDARPSIIDSVENMEQYDIIFLGYPIWWGDAPRIITSFMESYDFSGKTIVPFCTSGGSGIGSSAKNLHSLAASDVTWLDGERLKSGSSRDDLVSWINGLGLDVTAK